jgi:SH3 domain protein
MNGMKWLFFLILVCLFAWPVAGRTQTMYVTDQLYLSLRSTPDPENPAVALLQSDEKVEVITMNGDWAQVKLEDGRTGWVMKRYLVEELPKTLLIEDLREEIEEKEALIEQLEVRPAVQNSEELDSVKAEMEARQATLESTVRKLRNQLAQQQQRVVVNPKALTERRVKDIYAAAFMALLIGLLAGYLLTRPRRKRQVFF